MSTAVAEMGFQFNFLETIDYTLLYYFIIIILFTVTVYWCKNV